LATHDFKTGLLNESGIRKHVAGIQAEPGSGHALIWIDIDNFKRYNNEGYQEVGDRIIREVGHLLDGWWSARGWVARWGGDEFVAVLSVSKDELSQLCIDALRGLRQIPGRDPVSVSIGADWWEGGSFNQTLIRVEAAHKVAKEAGKARFVRYSPDMRKRNIPLYKRVLRRLV
jgi:diguanylate cyclase (GGDEF)-like protein